MTAKIKLSEKQKEVIRLMRQGWEFGTRSRQLNASTPLPDGYWLQKNGLGKGGETKKIYQRTVHSLVRAKIITSFSRNLGEHFMKSQLTDFSKQIVL